MTRTVCVVVGMTCGHCASVVSMELGELPGVADVRVDLVTGRVTVVSEDPLDEAAVHAAVVRAGYSVVAP